MDEEEKRLARNAYAREWRVRNKDKVIENNRKSREKQDKDERRAYNRAYYLANTEKCKANANRRYVEKRDEVLAYVKQYNKDHAEEMSAKAAARWRADLEGNRAKSRERRPAYYAANKDKVLAKSRAGHHANREVRLAQKRAWSAANPHMGAGYTAKRRAVMLQATPAWAEPFFIEGAYEIAALRTKATGIPWEVDHTVPLISDIVCGLHVEHNLRVIPKFSNRSKGNRHWPDMP